MFYTYFLCGQIIFCTVIHQRHCKQRVESVCDTGNDTGRIANNGVFTQCFHSLFVYYCHLNHTIQLVLKDAVGFFNLHKDVIIYLIAPPLPKG